MRESQVPDIVVGRLPIYLRVLNHLIAEGRQITSSQELGDRLGMSSAQIRKDLSHFGEFGKQGTGYNVLYLRDQLKQILNVDRTWSLVVIGAGDLGQALTHYHRFEKSGFEIAGIFDNDPQKIDKTVGRHVVQQIDMLGEVIRLHQVKIAIIAVPTAAAQDVTNKLIEHGVRAILNYAPITLNVPSNVYVQYIDPVANLQHMTHYLQEAESAEAARPITTKP